MCFSSLMKCIFYLHRNAHSALRLHLIIIHIDTKGMSLLLNSVEDMML